MSVRAVLGADSCVRNGNHLKSENVMNWARWTAAAVSLGLAGTAAGADDREQVMEKAAKNGWGMLVQECDKDGNGELSLAEFTVIQKNKTQAAEKFAVMDIDQNGSVVEDEYVTWVKNATRPAGRK